MGPVHLPEARPAPCPPKEFERIQTGEHDDASAHGQSQVIEMERPEAEEVGGKRPFER